MSDELRNEGRSPSVTTVESLLQKWDEAQEQGTSITIEELCADHPELVPILRKRIEALEAMDWLDRTPGKTTGRLTVHRSEERRFERPVPLLLSGRYQLQNLIAEGGYGQVWRAVDSALDRPVAIKLTTLPCVQEARRVASLKHQGIVSVHDVGNQGGFCFIVFDLIEGTDLAERIRQGRLPWRETVEIVAQVAEYVGFAHRRGYVHRDIKPANILLDRDGTPILADFGIAVTRTELEQQVTTTLGTVAYMAPEQLTADATADARIDIYGLGIVLYEALTGEVPFRARTLWQLREKILSEDPASVTVLAPELPAVLDSICRKCLAKSPADRYSTAEELARDLRELLDSR
jgi:serine/threonine protein kinase